MEVVIVIVTPIQQMTMSIINANLLQLLLLLLFCCIIHVEQFVVDDGNTANGKRDTIADCISIQNVIQRYLNKQQRRQLELLIENEFTGNNQDKVI